MKFLGVATAIVGAVFVIFPSVEVYYLWTGRMQPDMETLDFGAAVVLVPIGMVLLVRGYWLQE
jgi:hypothetical protein